MIPSQVALELVVLALTNAGFVPDGATRTEEVRVPTQRSPLLGRSGGKLATFGGRQRFAKPDTDLKATVGKQTTVVYRVFEEDGKRRTRPLAVLNTTNVKEIAHVLGVEVPTVADLPTEPEGDA